MYQLGAITDNVFEWDISNCKAILNIIFLRHHTHNQRISLLYRKYQFIVPSLTETNLFIVLENINFIDEEIGIFLIPLLTLNDMNFKFWYIQ